MPDLIAALAARWSLQVDAPFPNVEQNFVAPATRTDDTRCVLKVSRHVDDTRAGIDALRLWNGRGAARVLEADPGRGALLLERVEPGSMLDQVVTDDDEATRIAAGLLRQLWRPAPEAPHDLIPLERWCAAYERNRSTLRSGVDGFPIALFERGDRLRADLLASTTEPVVLHGDLHHFNILRSASRASRAEWLAIDPHGLQGDRCFDICQFLRNPEPMPLAVNRRRVEIFCSELGLDLQRAKDWCMVHAVLDACWSFEEQDPGLPDRVAYAEAMLEL